MGTSKTLPPNAIIVDLPSGRATLPFSNFLNNLTQNANAGAAGTVTTAVGSGLFGGGAVADGISIGIAVNGVTNAMIRQSAGYSVIGRFAGTAGDVADITATADNRVLARIGGVLAFWDAALVPGAIADGNYGDVTVSGSGTVITINANVVSNVKFRQSTALTVVGRSAATTGNVADIAGTASQFLGVNAAGTVLGFQTMAGDATLSGPTLTLATVNANTGTWGSATQAPVITLDGKGRATAASNVTITPAASSITGGAALTKADDTNVTLTLGGTPATALLKATSITAGWTGRLAYARFVAATQKSLVGATAAGDFGEITLGTGVAITGGVLSATGTGGTVTTVSVVTANGVSGSVANPTTTPAVTLTLGAITPSSVAASGTVTGSNLSGTNTGDQTITLTGDVSGSGTGSFAVTIGPGAVTNTKLAPMAQATFKMRAAGAGTGDPIDGTATQAKTALAIAASDVSGLAAIATSGSASDLTTGTLPAGRFPALTGDVTTSAGALATTLATVNSNVGTFGSVTKSATITVNAKGLVTAASEGTITPAVSSITGLGTGVATFLATPSSANLAAALTDETGTGSVVFSADSTLTGTTTMAGVRQAGTVAFATENTVATQPAGRAGQGLEYGSNIIQSVNRTTVAYGTFNLDGSTINLRPGGTTALSIVSGGADATGRLTATTYLKSTAKTVASLTAAATAGAGARDCVTDALAPTFGAAVVGGGAVTTPVFCTGAAWNVG